MVGAESWHAETYAVSNMSVADLHQQIVMIITHAAHACSVMIMKAQWLTWWLTQWLT